ncbi:MAG: FAD-dependent oxidoreductase [Anaerolineae bacterium]
MSHDDPAMGHGGQRIGVFVCQCGRNISDVVDVEAVREHAAALPDVVYSSVNRYSCSEPGQAEIRRAIVDHQLDRVVVASCSPRNYEPIFRECVAGAGLNPYLMQMANIREGVSWIHRDDPVGATLKAKETVGIAVAKAKWLQPLEKSAVKVQPGALVIGGGIAGIQAALDLADGGHQVHLVEKEASIGGKMAQLDKTYPTMDCSI